MNYDWKQQQPYAYWLECVKGLGRRTRWELVEAAGSAKAVYDMTEEEWSELLPEKKVNALLRAKEGCGVQENYQKFCARPIRYIPYSHPDYPEKLKGIPDPPFGIFLWGQLPPEHTTAVAVIGARECSEYGRYMAEKVTEELTAEGISIISGMARGIDSISQRAALRAGGHTYAVLGSGADICYPQESRSLYEALKMKGGILTEYLPGTQPAAGLFPQRNRIISGLADLVLIVEAREKSGTLITADMALEQGKEVWVVPGRLTDPLSSGCNRLMKQGAGILTSVGEMLEETGMIPRPAGKATDTAPEEKSALLRHLDFYPKSVERLIRESGMEYRQAVYELMELCMENKAEQVSPGQYVRKE